MAGTVMMIILVLAATKLGWRKTMAEASDYTYQVSWSKEDEEYVGTCAEFPLLSYCGKEVVETFDGIVEVVVSALDILKEEGQKIPAPFGTHCYSY